MAGTGEKKKGLGGGRNEKVCTPLFPLILFPTFFPTLAALQPYGLVWWRKPVVMWAKKDGKFTGLLGVNRLSSALLAVKLLGQYGGELEKYERKKKIPEKRGGLFLLELEKGYARMRVSIYVRVFKCVRERKTQVHERI